MMTTSCQSAVGDRQGRRGWAVVIFALTAVVLVFQYSWERASEGKGDMHPKVQGPGAQ